MYEYKNNNDKAIIWWKSIYIRQYLCIFLKTACMISSSQIYKFGSTQFTRKMRIDEPTKQGHGG